MVSIMDVEPIIELRGYKSDDYMIYNEVYDIYDHRCLLI